MKQVLRSATVVALGIGLLVGCAPSIQGANENTVVVSRSGFAASGGFAQALALAEEECAKYGRTAQLAETDVQAGIFIFDCVPSSGTE